MNKSLIILRSLILMLLGISCALTVSPHAFGFLPQQTLKPATQKARDDTGGPAGDRKIEIEFEGNEAFPAERLLEILKRESDRRELKCHPSKGEPDAEQLEYCLESAVLDFMRSQGYLRAEIGEPRRQESGGSLKIIVPVEEGIPYRIGEFKIQGAKLFSSEQIIGMLGVKTGDIASGSKLYEGLSERLRKAYGNKGHIQYEYDVEPTYKPSPDAAPEGVVDFDVNISEGPAFVLRSIAFEGDTLMPVEELKRTLLVSEGDTFNEQMFHDSFEKLNDLGVYEWVDSLRDVNFRTDEESAELYIKIRLKKRERPPI